MPPGPMKRTSPPKIIENSAERDDVMLPSTIAPRIPIVPTGVLIVAPPGLRLVWPPMKRNVPLVSVATTVASPLSGS